MAQVFLDILYSLGNCLNCFPGSPSLKINGRNFKILRLLGEVSSMATTLSVSFSVSPISPSTLL
jgi:hypothetical protein